MFYSRRNNNEQLTAKQNKQMLMRLILRPMTQAQMSSGSWSPPTSETLYDIYNELLWKGARLQSSIASKRSCNRWISSRFVSQLFGQGGFGGSTKGSWWINQGGLGGSTKGSWWINQGGLVDTPRGLGPRGFGGSTKGSWLLNCHLKLDIANTPWSIHQGVLAKTLGYQGVLVVCLFVCL